MTIMNLKKVTDSSGFHGYSSFEAYKEARQEFVDELYENHKASFTTDGEVSTYRMDIDDKGVVHLYEVREGDKYGDYDFATTRSKSERGIRKFLEMHTGSAFKDENGEWFYA